MLKVGVGSCFMHADPQRAIFKGKTLLYLVQDVGDWLMAQGLLPVLIPELRSGSKIGLPEIVDDLDGLLLQGGADVCPASYAETPLKPEWNGDRVRDLHEISLVQEFRRQKKPILGLCRGMQLLNVALGGSLFQDIETQVPGAQRHRDWNIYDENAHEIEITSGSGLARLYPGMKNARVNSIHHQGVRTLAPGLHAEAFSLPDRIVEAVRFDGDSYAVAVQWHPEFQKPEDNSQLSTKPLLEEFISEIKKRKKT